MVELNSVNYLNLLGFIINVLFTAFATLVFDLPDNATLSGKWEERCYLLTFSLHILVLMMA